MSEPEYNRIQGNFVEVIEAIGSGTDDYEPQTIKQYLDIRNKDIPRSSYVNFRGDANQLKNAVSDISHLYQPNPHGLVRLSADKNPLNMTEEEIAAISKEPYYALHEETVYYYNLENDPKIITIPVTSFNESNHKFKIKTINNLFPQEINVVKAASIDELLKLESTVGISLENKGKLIDENKPLSWRQGISTGLHFTTRTIRRSHKKKFAEEIQFKSIEEFGFTFIDDDEKLSSFSVSILRDNSDESIPVDQRKYNLNAVVIKDITAAPDDRTVTFFSDTDLITEEFVPRKSNTRKSKISGNFLFEQIAKSVNSVTINQLIKDIFTKDGLISIDNFRELNQRIKADQNIDNRDVRKGYLEEQIALINRYFEHDELNKIIKTIEDNAKNDINFFKEDNFLAVIDKITRAIDLKNNQELQRQNKLLVYAMKIEIVAENLRASSIAETLDTAALTVRQALDNPNDEAKIQHANQIMTWYDSHQKVLNNPPKELIDRMVPDDVPAPAQLGQGFIRRNLGMALLWSASVVMLVGVFAVLAGALAPLGIAVASGAGLLGGVLVAAGAAALSLVAVVRMQSNEKTFADDLAAFPVRLAGIKARQTAFNEYQKQSSAYNTNINELDTDLKDLMEASSEVPVVDEPSNVLINEVQSNLDSGFDAVKNSHDVPIMPNSSQSPSQESANNPEPSDAQPVVVPSLSGRM